MELFKESASNLSKMLRKKEISSTELTKRVRSYASSLTSKLLWSGENIYVFMDLMAEMLEGRDDVNKENILK